MPPYYHSLPPEDPYLLEAEKAIGGLGAALADEGYAGAESARKAARDLALQQLSDRNRAAMEREKQARALMSKTNLTPFGQEMATRWHTAPPAAQRGVEAAEAGMVAPLSEKATTPPLETGQWTPIHGGGPGRAPLSAALMSAEELPTPRTTGPRLADVRGIPYLQAARSAKAVPQIPYGAVLTDTRAREFQQNKEDQYAVTLMQKAADQFHRIQSDAIRNRKDSALSGAPPELATAAGIIGASRLYPEHRFLGPVHTLVSELDAAKNPTDLAHTVGALNDVLRTGSPDARKEMVAKYGTRGLSVITTMSKYIQNPTMLDEFLKATLGIQADPMLEMPTGQNSMQGEE